MPLSVMDFSGIEGNRFPFGLSAKTAADTLRRLGDLVESGELCLQSARVVGVAGPNQYAQTVIRLVVTEKRESTSDKTSSQEAILGLIPNVVEPAKAVLKAV